jgi:hypothetical protein
MCRGRRFFISGRFEEKREEGLVIKVLSRILIISAVLCLSPVYDFTNSAGHSRTVLEGKPALNSPAAGTLVAAQGDDPAPIPAPTNGPALNWNTFLGGTIESYGHAVALDSSKNIYIVGISNSSWGSPVRAYSGFYFDAFVAKLSPSGALLWNTFLGGAGDDAAHSIAVDSVGNVYIAGWSTDSWGSPVRGFLGGSYDVWAAKLNTNGGLQWSTFLGGDQNDTSGAIAVDASGNVYVSGNSTGTWGAPVNPFSNYDGFLAKLNGSGALQWNTFFGSSDNDDAWGVAVDRSGNIFVTGDSDSSWGSPVVPLTGNWDGFVAKFDASGALQWNTFLGSPGNWVTGYSATTDIKGNIYVAGLSNATWGSPVNPFASAGDAFAAKLNAGGVLQWNSFLGGADWDQGESVAVDLNGNVFVGGYSYADWGTPSLPFYGVDGPDVFAAKLTAGGALAWNAFLRSTDLAINYWGQGIAVDGAGGVFVAGTSEESWGTPIRAYSGITGAYVAKLGEDPVWRQRHAVGDFDGDGADELVVDFGATGAWLYNQGAWSQLTASNPESLVAADVDGDNVDELVADLGAAGLWLWNAGAWNQLSGVNAESLAAGDVDADGAAEIIGDFGAAGLWLYNGGAWTQLSGVNAEYVTTANVNGTGGDEIIGDFGAIGLWMWSAGSWTQLSGVNAEYVTSGSWSGGHYLVGDFGALGLWQWKSGAWTQLSGVNATYVMTADLNADGQDELVGAFGLIGLWSFDGFSWTQLSGLAADFIIKADTDGDGDYAVVGDFGATGLWLDDGGAWTQLSGVNPDYMMAGDFDGDNKDEIAVDFGALGLWLWNEGTWIQISGLNPD